MFYLIFYLLYVYVTTYTYNRFDAWRAASKRTYIKRFLTKELIKCSVTVNQAESQDAIIEASSPDQGMRWLAITFLLSACQL